MKWHHFDDFGNIYCFYVVTTIKLFILISFWGKLWMKSQLFNIVWVPVNMQNASFYQQNPAILIFLTKCNFKNSMLWKWKFPIFEKQLILSISFPFIDNFTLNIDKINGFLKFWPLMTFFGLHWPFWPLWPWMIFLSKNWPLLIKMKHNWPVSNNQVSKPISKLDRAFWISVYIVLTKKCWPIKLSFSQSYTAFYELKVNNNKYSYFKIWNFVKLMFLDEISRRLMVYFHG